MRRAFCGDDMGDNVAHAAIMCQGFDWISSPERLLAEIPPAKTFLREIADNHKADGGTDSQCSTDACIYVPISPMQAATNQYCTCCVYVCANIFIGLRFRLRYLSSMANAAFSRCDIGIVSDKQYNMRSVFRVVCTVSVFFFLF